MISDAMKYILRNFFRNYIHDYIRCRDIYLDRSSSFYNMQSNLGQRLHLGGSCMTCSYHLQMGNFIILPKLARPPACRSNHHNGDLA